MNRFWYNTTRWRKRRQQQLMNEPFCRICAERNVATPATVADHVIPHDGDWNMFWLGELQSLCAAHHNGSKKEIEFRGYCSDVGMDGWPLDPKHYANTGTIQDSKTVAVPLPVVSLLLPE